MPSFRTTPISKFNRTQPLLSWAFPTLFPRRDAEYTLPRPRSVSYGDYVDHLLKYHDGRFARHPRFRFVVFNTMMRRKVSTQAVFFVKKHINASHNSTVTADDLRVAFEEDTPESKKLLSHITSWSCEPEGTRPFWLQKRRGLTACVKNLESPHLFATHSAADLHWDDLMIHLPRYDAG
jgi:Helitron helicase-like domain at N-terminus